VTLDAAIVQVQFTYPQIYYACHTRHGRRRSTEFRLSESDAALLVHLDSATGARVSELAAHLSLSRSTVSAALSRLSALGYVAKARSAEPDRRQVRLGLTPAGIAAVRATSVLEARRLRTVLGRLSPGDLRQVVRGLGCLSRACRAGTVAGRARP
jgi:DNA-binding MarR family transcriptional regulator